MSELKEIPKEEKGKDLLIAVLKLTVPWVLVLLALSFFI
jgi:hypothetical protein